MQVDKKAVASVTGGDNTKEARKEERRKKAAGKFSWTAAMKDCLVMPGITRDRIHKALLSATFLRDSLCGEFPFGNF